MKKKEDFDDLITIQIKINGGIVNYRVSELKEDVDGRLIIDGLAVILSKYLKKMRADKIKLPESLKNFNFNIEYSERWLIDRSSHLSMKRCLNCGAHIDNNGPEYCYDCWQEAKMQIDDESANTIIKVCKDFFKEQEKNKSS